MLRGKLGLHTHFSLELFILDSGWGDSEMAMEHKGGVMALSIKVNGRIIGHMAKVNLYILMVIRMKVIG